MARSRGGRCGMGLVAAPKAHIRTPPIGTAAKGLIPACAGNTGSRNPPRARRPAHPRVRGEHGVFTDGIRTDWGSSPRARGTHRGHHVLAAHRRLIPACAGNTGFLPSPCRAAGAHPRVRGEHQKGGVGKSTTAGSSPRARGTRERFGAHLAGSRLIPACAGNTTSRSTSTASRTAHPRVRGEHAYVIDPTEVERGSSPRARGTPGEQHGPVVGRGLIPACAGNTSRGARARSRPPAHPRVRGEHEGLTAEFRRLGGSSPRARGTRVVDRLAGRRRRLIPACAGNTVTTPLRASARAAHPRARGEHAGIDPTAESVVGSSPHTRGTHRHAGRDHRRVGLIPACAGNTVQPAGGGPGRWAHPRVRGEHGQATLDHAASNGSSPRARGTLLEVGEVDAGVGLIPACAGNTRASRTAPPCARAHPRVRGEHSNQVAASGRRGGSSPRARGTPRARPPRHGGRWLIPACAGNTRSRHSRPSWTPAHPRVRGEHRLAPLLQVRDDGSSPRARGTPLGASTEEPPHGLIPACAGNTTVPLPTCSTSLAHPRVRGEHFPSVGPRGRVPGSSPRARGTPARGVPRGLGARLIPACAGNTLGRDNLRPRIEAHPRVRGEHNRGFDFGFQRGGSSPRARGTQAVQVVLMVGFRLIPACAGNTRTG